MRDPLRSPRDGMRLRRHEALLYDGLCQLFERAGIWRSPGRRSGDLEEATFLDKLYWVYKSTRPIERALVGSGLEAFFTRQPTSQLPPGLRVTHELRISAVGDLMPHPYLDRSGHTLYERVADLVFGADIVMANLEGVVTAGADEVEVDLNSGPLLAIAPAAFAVLAGDGGRSYDVLAMANNHCLDFGEAGVDESLQAVRTRSIACHGTNACEDEAERATIVERAGIRIGVVAHTFGTNAHAPPAHRPRIVNHTKLNRRVHEIDFSLLEKQLHDCRTRGVDFVIAQLHWGMEFEAYPRPEQLAVAHHIAELGADAIIGHHPHIIQPTEIYRTARDPDRQVPVYYSLGNLTTPFCTPFMQRSRVAQLVLAKGTRPDGRVATYVREATSVDLEQTLDRAARTLALRPIVR